MNSSYPLPRPVKLALWVATIGLLVGLINTVRFWQPLHERVGFLVGFGQIVVPTGLFVLILVFIARRKKWARNLFLILIALSVPGYLSTVIATVGTLTAWIQGANGLCFLASGVLLLLGQSRAWFRGDDHAV